MHHFEKHCVNCGLPLRTQKSAFLSLPRTGLPFAEKLHEIAFWSTFQRAGAVVMVQISGKKKIFLIRCRIRLSRPIVYAKWLTFLPV